MTSAKNRVQNTNSLKYYNIITKIRKNRRTKMANNEDNYQEPDLDDEENQPESDSADEGAQQSLSPQKPKSNGLSSLMRGDTADARAQNDMKSGNKAGLSTLFGSSGSGKNGQQGEGLSGRFGGKQGAGDSAGGKEGKAGGQGGVAGNLGGIASGGGKMGGLGNAAMLAGGPVGAAAKAGTMAVGAAKKAGQMARKSGNGEEGEADSGGGVEDKITSAATKIPGLPGLGAKIVTSEKGCGCGKYLKGVGSK